MSSNFGGSMSQSSSSVSQSSSSSSQSSSMSSSGSQMNVSFAGCGFLGLYHLGVASCLKSFAPQFCLGKVNCVCAVPAIL
jgi:hypothetical protein